MAMGLMSRLGTVAAGSIRTVEIPRSGNFTLAAGDRGKRIVCSTPLTVTVPSASALGDGFSAEIIGAASLGKDDRVSVVMPDDVAFAGRARIIRVFVTAAGVAAATSDLQCLPT
jgi:hypothetical protein